MRRTVMAALLFTTIGSSAAQAQAAADFPPGPQKALVQKACTVCHAASQVTLQHKSADQWSQTVQKMVGYGATVGSDADVAAIVGYLARNYGPADRAAAGATTKP